MPTTAPPGRAGATGGIAGWVPSSTTSGWYIESAPVAGSMIAASTNADWSALASLQGPAAGSVALSRYGVARPAAEVALGGTISVQLRFGLAGGGAPAVVVGVVPGDVIRAAAPALGGLTSSTAVRASRAS